MAPQSQTLSLTTLISSTFPNVKEEFADAVFKNSALLGKMWLNGRKDIEDGGHQIQRTVEIGTNETVGAYEGYEVLDDTPQDPLTDVWERWAEIAGTVTVSAREEAANRGKARIRNQTQAKLENLRKSMTETINGYILNPGATAWAADAPAASGKAPVSLTTILSLAANTCHNMSASTYSVWDNQRKISGSSNNAGGGGSFAHTAFKNEWRNFYNTCSKSNEGRPDLILTGQEAAETYEASLEGQVRYAGGNGLASLGFDGNVMLGRAEVCWDEVCPGTAANPTSSPAQTDWVDYSTKAEEVAFFINTDYLKWVAMQGRDMELSEFFDARVNNQTAKKAILEIEGQLMCTNRRVMGVFYGIDTSAVTFS